MGRSLGATASSASQHPCALGQDYARCLAPKMQERRGFRSSTLHNLENYIKPLMQCTTLKDSIGCGTLASSPTGCARRSSRSAAASWDKPPDPLPSKRRWTSRHLRCQRRSQDRCVRSASTGVCNWCRPWIDSRRRGTCLCPRLDSTPHRGGRRDSVRSRPARQAWAAWRGVVRPPPPPRHLSRVEATPTEAVP